MVTRIARDLVPYRGPAISIDQRRMLAGVKLVFMGNLASVDRVREHRVNVSAREGFAATLGAIRRCAAFRAKPEAVGFLLYPAHAAELTIESEDAAHGLGLGRVDDERALVGVVAQRHIAAHPHSLLL